MTQEAQVLIDCHVTINDALDLAVKMAGRARKYKKLYKRVRKFPRCPYCGRKLLRIHIECHDASGWEHCWTCNCAANKLCDMTAVG